MKTYAIALLPGDGVGSEVTRAARETLLAVSERFERNFAFSCDYEIGTGDPKFASVQLPIGIGDSLYTLIVHGQAFALAGGDTFDFAAHGFANGVAQFRVADIEASAGLDPSNAAAFPTGLTFTTAGTFTGTMTPLCRSTPLPDHAKSPVGRGLSPCLSQ